MGIQCFHMEVMEHLCINQLAYGESHFISSSIMDGFLGYDRCIFCLIGKALNKNGHR